MQQIQSNQEATCTWARTTTIMMKEYAWAKIYEKKRAVLLLLFDDTELQCRQLGIDVDRLDIKSCNAALIYKWIVFSVV